MSQGVGVDNATSLAALAISLRDVFDTERTRNVTRGTWMSAFRVVNLLSDIRERHPSTAIHADELEVIFYVLGGISLGSAGRLLECFRVF